MRRVQGETQQIAVSDLCSDFERIKMPLKPSLAKKKQHAINERLAIIRRQNVERHAGQEARNLLRANIRRKQANDTFRSERDRLIAASVKGPLAGHAERRLKELKEILK